MARLCQVGRNAFRTTLWNLENVCNFNENTNLLLVLVHMCMAAHPPPTHEFTLCTHTNTYVSTYVHTHTYVYTNAHVNIYTQTHTHTHPFTRMDMNTKVREGRRKRERYIGKNLSRKQCLQFKKPREQWIWSLFVLYTVPLIYMSVFVPVPYCFDDCNLIPLLGI